MTKKAGVEIRPSPGYSYFARRGLYLAANHFWDKKPHEIADELFSTISLIPTHELVVIRGRSLDDPDLTSFRHYLEAFVHFYEESSAVPGNFLVDKLYNLYLSFATPSALSNNLCVSIRKQIITQMSENWSFLMRCYSSSGQRDHNVFLMFCYLHSLLVRSDEHDHILAAIKQMTGEYCPAEKVEEAIVYIDDARSKLSDSEAFTKQVGYWWGQNILDEKKNQCFAETVRLLRAARQRNRPKQDDLAAMAGEIRSAQARSNNKSS